ncbi:MAG: hypothetical protein GXO88_10180 [Chlorobi bacterium]|nr:hypothetical protein [Chlorobiota bacterium]
MNSFIILEFLAFTEWYHYAILFLWLIILFFGFRYMSDFEKCFTVEANVPKNTVISKNLVAASFLIGLLMVISAWLIPAQSVNYQYYINIIKYGSFGIIIILIIYNFIVSLKSHKKNSGIAHGILLSLIMLIYFFSGMFSGLLIAATFALALIIYALIKLYKTLKIK